MPAGNPSHAKLQGGAWATWGTVLLASLSLAGALAQAEPIPSTVRPGDTNAVAANRPTRRLESDELCELLVAAMGRRGAAGAAEWELHLTRPWAPLVVTDEPLKAEIIEPTPERMGPASILRFELRQGGRLLGSWQMPVQAKLWREVLVARSNLQRGSPLVEAALEHERRDVLALREPMTDLPSNADACELDETVSAGSPLLGRAIKTRPVVFRGQMADAVVRDGALVISLKVEVMEEGIPGQVVRVRNPQSRRELRGKVQDERTIVIPL